MTNRRRWLAPVLAVATLWPSATATATRPAVADRAHRLFMVSDSVGLGAISAMRTAFSGWQVTITGKPGLFTETLVSYVNSAPASAFGDDAIVATGYNYPYWDPARFDRSVDQMVAALKNRGVRHIFWVTMREVKPAYYSKWNGLNSDYRTLYLAYPHTNDQLRSATVRHPELSIIDWASVADQTGLSYDAIHLNPTGAALYAGLAHTTVETARTRLPAGTVTEVPVAGLHGVPADAAAVSVNVTAINPRSAGTVSVVPCGAVTPRVGNLLLRAGRTSSISAIVKVGAGGSICVRQSTDANVVLDLQGASDATSGYHRVAPQRVLDSGNNSIPSGSIRTVALASITGAPSGAFVAILGISAKAALDGRVRVYTCGTTPPPVASLIATGGLRTQLLQLVRTDATGHVCVVTNGGASVSLDLFGWFDGGSAIHAIRARRMLDSRSTGGALLPGLTRTLQIGGQTPVPAAAVGAAITLTLLDPAAAGTASLFPCARKPAPTTLVASVPNHAVTASAPISLAADGRLCVRSSVRTNFTIDVSGWMGPGFVALPSQRLLDSTG